MNIVIFGGTGFFGRNLVDRLESYNTVCVTREQKICESSVEYVTYKNFEKEKFENYFDLAIDFASHVSVEKFLLNPREAFLENIDIPIKNIRLLEDVGFRGKYLYISTDRALVNSYDGHYVNGLEIKNDPYGASKFIGELIVQYSSSLGWSPSTILRFPNLYGKGQTSRQLIPTILQRLSEGEECIELGSLTGSRNYLYVSDAVDALMKFIEFPIDGRQLCVSGENVKIEEIVKCFSDVLRDEYGRNVKFTKKDGFSLRKNYKNAPDVMDDRNFRETYLWKPKVNIKNGIKLLLESRDNES